MKSDAAIGIIKPIPQNELTNADFAPTKQSARTWNVWNFTSLWVGMSVCIPTYMLSASMIESGMTWWQSLIVIFFGNALVLVPLMINGHAGTKYGIPFPVFVRSSYGIKGAHIPSLLRALVACGWCGIQIWIGGLAIHAILGILWPGWNDIGSGWTLMGYTFPHYLSFFIFWLMNLYFVLAGSESIKWMETLAAPFLLLMGIALLVWMAVKVGGLGLILQKSDALITAERNLSFGQFIFKLFLPWLTAMVGFWATLSLNIPDFTRYARSQKDQIIGQGIGLLTTMPLFSFIGIAVTSATLILYGEAIWNPVTLLARLTSEYQNPLVGLISMFFLLVATLSTNIAANVVSPANSFSNLKPQKINFKLGGLIALVIATVILPWKLLDMYQTWLISYSGFLGAAVGVIICDYIFVRRGRLNLKDLYSTSGQYVFTRGFNRRALLALVSGVAVALAGKLHPVLSFLFDGAWFSATLVSFGVYYFLMREKKT